MAKWQTGDLGSRSQIQSDDEYIELSELDFDDLPPTDPIGIRPRLVPAQPQRNTDFDQLRQFLRTPACVQFEDDRVVDLTPPPVVGSSSIAPTSASLSPQHVKRDDAFSTSSRWSLGIVALSATLAIGIIAYRVADTGTAFAPSAPAAAVQPATVIPSFAPEDFPVFEDPADDKVEWTWIDLTNAPREDWPASGKPPSTVSAKAEGKAASAAVVDIKKESAPIDDPVGEEIASNETIAPAAARAFDQDEASASLSAAAGSAIACRGDAPSGFAKVSVTFAPSGRVTTAVVDGPFAGTLTGGCIAKVFRNARVHPFDGSLVTVRKTVILK